MKLSTLISLPNEPWLEKWARLARFNTSLPVLRELLATKKTFTIVDYGCGQDILYYKFLEHHFPQDMARITYVGIDPLIKKKPRGNVTILKSQFESVQFPEKADLVVMFAVIEHVDDATVLIREALKQLKKGGHLVATTPSPLAKPVLEFFSYILGIIATREIDEHKRYPTRSSLLAIIASLSNTQRGIVASHHYFECGLNNYLHCQKK